MDSSCCLRSNWMPKLNKEHFEFLFSSLKFYFKPKHGCYKTGPTKLLPVDFHWLPVAGPHRQTESLHLRIPDHPVENVQSACDASSRGPAGCLFISHTLRCPSATNVSFAGCPARAIIPKKESRGVGTFIWTASQPVSIHLLLITS